MRKYTPAEDRYSAMEYRRCGSSGLMLPVVSLGFWHNFGADSEFEDTSELVFHAFDKGITHFDLANNYGPPPGSAEENFGRILRNGLKAYRDEIVISTKAGYTMWPGPYGDFGSRKYLMSSIDQSLRRMEIDYVDIFYSHRPDPETPLEETMGALSDIVRQGKALYVGISNYGTHQTERALDILRRSGTPFIVNQSRYSMLDRHVEDGLIDSLDRKGLGLVAFSPLAQGVLTGKYLDGVSNDSRAGSGSPFLKPEQLTNELNLKIKKLKTIADKRGQSLTEMAIAWLLKDSRLTSVLVGVSKISQLDEILGATVNYYFSDDELSEIDKVLND